MMKFTHVKHTIWWVLTHAYTMKMLPQLRSYTQGIPWPSSGYNSALSLPRAWVQSLIKTLRSQELGGIAKKKKKKIIHTSFISQSFLLLFCNQSLPVLTLCSQDTLFFFKAIKIMFAFSKILYKWNHIVFFVWIVLFSIVSLRFIHIMHVSIVLSFLQLSSIPSRS